MALHRITVVQTTPLLDPWSFEEVGTAEAGGRFRARRADDDWVLAVDGRGQTAWIRRAHVETDDPTAFRTIPAPGAPGRSAPLITLFVAAGVFCFGFAGAIAMAGYGTTPSIQDRRIVDSLAYGGLLLAASGVIAAFLPRSIRKRSLLAGLVVTAAGVGVANLLIG